MAITPDELIELPVSDRLRFVTQVWESIAAAPENIELTEETRKLLRERFESSVENPEKGSSWAEVRDRIESK